LWICSDIQESNTSFLGICPCFEKNPCRYSERVRVITGTSVGGCARAPSQFSYNLN
jgi:hypothetical protein